MQYLVLTQVQNPDLRKDSLSQQIVHGKGQLDYFHKNSQDAHWTMSILTFRRQQSTKINQ